MESQSVPLQQLVVPSVQRLKTLRMLYVAFFPPQFASLTKTLSVCPVDVLSPDRVIYNVKIFMFYDVQFSHVINGLYKNISHAIVKHTVHSLAL